MSNALQSLYQAIEHASPIWQQAVYHLSWSHGLVASTYGLAAWLCLLNGQTEKQVLGSCALWCAAAVFLCLLGANVVLQADVWVTQTLRAWVQLQGWYGQRRVWQYLVLGLLALAVLLALRSKMGLSPTFRRSTQASAGAASAGLLALLLLFVVRLVSAHGTDAVLNARLVGIAVGRFFELAGLAWVMWGAWCSLRQPWANPNPKLCQRGINRHV